MNRTFGQLARAALDLGVTTDGHLLADFVAWRDDAAFAALVRRHGPMVLAVCRRVLRHQQDAEDAFQATFLVLARKAEDVWPREAVGAWLHGVAYRVAMKARGVRAKLARREHPLEDAPRLPPEPPCPDLAGVLDRAIRKLPEVYRAAVVACDLEGRTRKDAAEQLGWKEGTLSGRLSRARQLLAARLRKMGLAVPVGAVFTNSTADALPARLTNAVVRASMGSHAAGVSAPVAALTEGVVRSMFLVKLKTAAVGMLAACMLGLGVWSASGQGPGSGEGSSPAQPPAKRTAKAAEPSDADRVQGEWIIGRRYIESNPYLPQSVVEATVNAAKKDGTLITIDGAKMSWPVVLDLRSSSGTTSSEGTSSATTDTGTSLVTVTPRAFTIKLDPTQSPKHIDLTDEKGKVTKGIYKFEDGYFVFVLNETGGRPKGFDTERVSEPMWTLWQPRQPQKKAVAAPPRPDPADEMQRERIEWARRMVKLGYMSQAQLDWELRNGDPDARALQGKWKIDWIWVNKGDAQSSFIVPGAQTSLTNKDDARSSLTAPGTATPLEFTGNTLLMPYLDASTGIKTVVYTFAVDSSKSPKEIDLIANGKPVGKGIYQFDGASGLRIAVSLDGKRPAMIEQRGRDGVITFELSRPAQNEGIAVLDEMYDLKARQQAERRNAQRDTTGAFYAVKDAEAEAELARKSVIASQIQLQEATKKAELAAAVLESAQAKLKVFEGRAAALKEAGGNAPAKGATFTLHTRTPLAAEKVEWTQLTGSDAVVDVIGKSADASKLAPTASLWIVRAGKALPIDWVAITKNGVTTTNYQIMPGDQLFVQVNVNVGK